MANMQEIDMVMLTKSMKLLHSSDEDSIDQLRIILEETIKHKYGNKKPINLIGLGLNKKSFSALAEEPVKSKRLKLEDTPTKAPLYSNVIDENHTSGSDSDDGVALEILDDDLSCIFCREMAVGAGNNLVECLECHSLYHQECHNPPITQDVNDPRCVWYCANCTKSMNKVGASNATKPTPTPSALSSKSCKTSSKSSAPSSKSFGAFSNSGKSSSSSSGASSKHSSSHSGSKSSNASVPKINITADKRLQIMKKNAAKKQEKKKIK